MSELAEPLNRQIQRLKQQIVQSLERNGFEHVEVRSYFPLSMANPELRPTLTILSPGPDGPTIYWVIDIDRPESPEVRFDLYAHYGVAEYWALSTEQVELRTYRILNRSNKASAVHQLWHVGELVSPLAFPRLTLQLQEPLSLPFLTRTATGTHTYTETMLSLQVQDL